MQEALDLQPPRVKGAIKPLQCNGLMGVVEAWLTKSIRKLASQPNTSRRKRKGRPETRSAQKRNFNTEPRNRTSFRAVVASCSRTRSASVAPHFDGGRAHGARGLIISRRWPRLRSMPRRLLRTRRTHSRGFPFPRRSNPGSPCAVRGRRDPYRPESSDQL